MWTHQNCAFHVWWFIHTYMRILSLTKQWKCCIKLTQLFMFLNMPHLPTLSLLLTDENEGLKGKGTTILPVFLCQNFQVSGWLIQGSAGSNKRHGRISRLLGLLRRLLPSILPLEPVLGRVESAAPRWGQHLHLCSHRCSLPCTWFQSSRAPQLLDPQEFCARGALWVLCESGVAVKSRQA